MKIITTNSPTTFKTPETRLRYAEIERRQKTTAIVPVIEKALENNHKNILHIGPPATTPFNLPEEHKSWCAVYNDINTGRCTCNTAKDQSAKDEAAFKKRFPDYDPLYNIGQEEAFFAGIKHGRSNP